jgi:hypothetical protein
MVDITEVRGTAASVGITDLIFADRPYIACTFSKYVMGYNMQGFGGSDIDNRNVICELGS